MVDNMNETIIKKTNIDSLSIDSKVYILFFLGFLSLVFKSFLLTQPYIMGDELSYKTMATAYSNYRDFYHFSSYEIGHAINIPNVLYQFIISVSFYFGDNFYVIMKILNSLLASTFIFPIYFLLKEFHIQLKTSMFVILTLFFLPELNYVVNIMPENLYLSLFIMSFYVSYLAITRLTIQLAAVSAFFCTLLYLTKPHAIVFVAGFYSTLIILLLFRYISLNRKLVIFCLIHSLSLIAIYTIVCYFLNVHAGLGVYSKPLSDFHASIDFLKFGKLIGGHLFSILLIYGLPITSIVLILVKHKKYDKKLIILNLFTLIVSFLLFAMVAKFTNDISGAEHYARLHGRYYYMIFPILVTLFIINLQNIKVASGVWAGLLISFIFGFFIIFAGAPFEWNLGYVSDNISLTWLILFHDKRMLLIIFAIVSVSLVYSNIKNYLLIYIFIGLATNYSFFTATKAWHHNDATKANIKTELAKQYLDKVRKDVILIGPDHLARMNTAFWYPDTFISSISLVDKSIISKKLLPNNAKLLVLFGNYEVDSSLILQKQKICQQNTCIDIVYLNSYLDEIIYFNQDVYSIIVESIKGLSDKETFGRWTDAKLSPSAIIEFRTKLPKFFRVELVTGAFETNIGSSVKVKIGNQIKEFIPIDSNPNKYILEFENINDTNQIEIIPPKPISPEELNMSKDQRKLGLSLISLKIIQETK